MALQLIGLNLLLELDKAACPLSPYLFIRKAELMSNKIRQSSEVKGISLFNNEIKLNEFADDTKN